MIPPTWKNPAFWQALRDAVAQSWPILIVQALVAFAFVFVDQGRVFLMVQDLTIPSYLLLLLMAQTALYVRVLTTTVDPHPESRARYEGLVCGAILIGLVGAFLLPLTLEDFVSRQECALPARVVTNFKASAAGMTLMLALGLMFVAAWWVQSDRANRPSSNPDALLLLWFVPASMIANVVWPSHRLAVFAVLVAVGFLVAGLSKLSKAATPTAPGRAVRYLAAAIGTTSLLAGLAAVISPIWISGSGPALLLVLQFWSTVGVIAWMLLRRIKARSRIAFVGALLGVLVVFWQFVDGAFKARDARTLESAAVVRTDLVSHAAKWLSSRRSEIVANAPYPVILVAAEGGGIRAGYWTAGLLGALTDRNSAFARHVFAISSVSGGSVGAGVFAGLVKSRCSDCQSRAASILGHDFLAPTLATMLIRDVGSTTLHVGGPDRAMALEQAFERAWAGAMGSQLMADPLDRLWADGDDVRVPALFLNTTEAGSAKRVVVSHLAMPEAPQLDVNMQRAVAARRFRLSTAVLLSARFPYVSPEGKLPGTSLRLVDGGFFDNSGAATAMDVMRALNQAAQESGLANHLRAVVMIVENGPDVQSACPPSEDSGGALTPLSTLDSIRSAQAARFAQELRDMTGRQSGILIDRLRPQGGAVEFPLGWTLSSTTRDEMDKQITALAASTTGPMAEMFQLLGPKPTAESR